MKSYPRYLDTVVDELFSEAAKKWTWQNWAAESGVCYSTIYRLGMRITQRPQLRTVFLLARSLGMNLPSIVIKTRLRKVA